MGHHSLMSASDAAPLPRLGEVFFDVRGSSRTMRLSWYADTGVAVFSIWQGGMCTGTFRLPIDDLPRMIEVLQRGPHDNGRDPHSADRDWAGPDTHHGQRDFPTGSMLRPDRDGRHAQHPRAAHEGIGEPMAPDHGWDEVAGSRRSGYSRDEAAIRRQPAPRQTTGDTGASFGSDPFSDRPYSGYQPEVDAMSGAGTPGWGGSTQPGYGQERFVPRYARGTTGDYTDDIPAAGTDARNADRRAAYRGNPPAGRSESADYPGENWAAREYDDDRRY